MASVSSCSFPRISYLCIRGQILPGSPSLRPAFPFLLLCGESLQIRRGSSSLSVLSAELFSVALLAKRDKHPFPPPFPLLPPVRIPFRQPPLSVNSVTPWSNPDPPSSCVDSRLPSIGFATEGSFAGNPPVPYLSVPIFLSQSPRSLLCLLRLFAANPSPSVAVQTPCPSCPPSCSP